jgi:acetyl esterase/lipase
MKTLFAALPCLARLLARGALVGFGLSGLARAAPPAAPLESGTSEIPLWPGPAPGSKDLALAEVVSERSSDPAVQDRFVKGITKPRLVVFTPLEPNGVALIIAPGGSYVREVLDKEGFETARWMAKRGVSAFVLLYRLPGEGHAARADVPLQDAQRAILADDDRTVVPENSLLFYRALRSAGVPAELHIFSRGQHGFGIRGARGLPIGEWPALAWAWWATLGVVAAPAPRAQ